ncbi:MAG: tRNA uridine(34) 5-carboxymethylaminomethyl modification radical SAM/GNAT enzyme Elp3 [Candidatus Nanoarchaeia archaeon]|nr:tRNA uridine(34) 5-carboxymethylaminomethyl modification radical SAM/GNAT enzyme Elp3 [Candidatus Nanoarchaeia archaeon]
MYEQLIEKIKEIKPSKNQLNRLKWDLCKELNISKVPTDAEIFMSAKKEDIQVLRGILQTKPTRTISGVAPLALFSIPHRCPHGKCTFCVGGIGSPFGDVPQAYTGGGSAVRRAIRNKYDSYLQVFNRLEHYFVNGHEAAKVDIIIMGGTFPALDKNYQEDFVKNIFKAMNDFSDIFFVDGEFDYIKFREFFELPVKDIESQERVDRLNEKIIKFKTKCSLEEEKKKNETSNIKCIGLTIETKPDWALLEHGNLMLSQGCTRVEVGIQSVYDDVLKFMHRGHTFEDTKNSIRILKDLGFKINTHHMNGLIEDRERDFEGMKQIFSNPDLRPDMIKIYPCLVFKGTGLYTLWKEGKFIALPTEEAAEMIADFKKYVPEYCRIMRVQRDLPHYEVEGGVKKPNLRQYVDKAAKRKGIKCRCIRCREIKHAAIKNPELKVMEYEASKGKEYFISFEENDKIIGFCRLRFPSQLLRSEITEKSALIRELHVYSPALAIGSKGEFSQHKGFGRKLVEKAEEIAKSNGKDKVVVISGVGVREYYKKLGYDLEGPYMVKSLSS